MLILPANCTSFKTVVVKSARSQEFFDQQYVFFLKDQRIHFFWPGISGLAIGPQRGACSTLLGLYHFDVCVLAVFLQISSLTKILNARKHISGEVFVRGNLFLRRTDAHMGLVDTKAAGPWGSGVLELGARKKKGQSERKGPDINPPFFNEL